MVDVVVLSKDSERAELVEALLMVNAEARREMQRDNLGRVNEHWVGLHAFMDMLLDWIVAADRSAAKVG